MEKYYPEVGTPLFLKQNTGSYYIDLVKTPYTVIGQEHGKLLIQECRLIAPVYHCVGNPYLDRPDLEGQRVFFYNTIAESIEPDENGQILALNWSTKHNRWQIDEYKSGYPKIAYFGKYEHYPYLD